MTLIKENAALIQEKNINLFLNDCDTWKNELDFIGVEVGFLKTVLTSYSFKDGIPNLFERIALFTGDLEAVLVTKNHIHNQIEKHQQLLVEVRANKATDGLNLLIEQHQDLEKKASNFLTTYKAKKIALYEYMLSLIHK